MLEILGYTAEEMTSDTFEYASIVHPKDYEEAKKEVVKHTEKGSNSYQQIYRLKTKGGAYRWFYDQTQCIVNQNGEVVERRGYLMDQTPLKEAEEQASQKQKELDRYFESSLDLLCIANVKGEFVRLNPEWGKVLGYPKEKLEGKLFLDFVHPDDMEKTLEAIQDLSNQREVVKFENRYRSADGSYRWIEWRSRPEGELIYAVARDITDRIDYQEKLKDYQSRLSQAQLFTKAGIWEYNIQKSTLEWSPECEALFGLEKGTFEGTFEAFMGFVHPEDRDYVTRMNRPVIELKEGTSLRYEHRIIKTTGEILWVQETAGVIRDSEGEPNKITGFVIDITENKEKEKTLREREKQLEMFFNQSFHGFFFCMLDEPIEWNETIEKDKVLEYALDHQRMTKVNKAVLDQYGAKEEDFLGITVRELFQHDLHHAREIWHGLFDKGRWHVETKEQKMNGTPIIIDGEYTCLYDEKGRITGHFGVQMDVMEQKKAQQQLEENEKRLELKNQELKKASQDAQAATKAKSQFLANMSHEIRTPMNGILGFLQLLEETETDQQQSKYIDYIKTSSETLLILINDILDVSKIESGKMELESISFDLRSTIEDAIIPQSHRAHSKNIELHLYIHPYLPGQVKGDPTRIRQIISNLVSNAVKFTATGSVTVECRLLEKKKKNARVVIVITDTGIGISEQAQQTLFNSFTQADPSNTREYGGSGLGLTITRDLVQLMKGDITVKSSLGEGSTFTVTLPLEIDSTSVPNLVDHQLLKGKHIVVVDDTTSNREMFRNYLEEAGCLVTEASRGSETIEILLKLSGQNQNVHGVLIDQQMPGMGGDDLAIALKAIPDTKEIPLCLITSVVTANNAQLAKEKGFQAYLTKPLRRRDLLDAVASMLFQEKEERQQEQNLITRHSIREARDHEKSSVLVVEDQAVNRALAVQLLSNRGMRCEVAVNGKEAVEACRSNHYDLVLMDVQMPVMDGLEATRQIRKLDIIQQPRIAAMTAHAMKEDEEKCLAAGMDAYLSKPIDFDEVNALLQENMALTQVKKETGKEVKPDNLGQQVLEKIMKDTGFDKDFVSSLLKEGIQGCLESAKTVLLAMEKDDFDEVKAQLHSIKGVAANLRLHSVALWAEEGEKQVEKKEKEAISQSVTKIQNCLWEIADKKDEEIGEKN
ncbi:PAS domain-containing protein [Tindallia californiensis]|uniref:Circadian input-output histidine kinase CikA n=1 Tax=Tindallia californiensis TaxID=159292 RepID=A0A1H3KGC3_9FIRM|nr:PAS domain-containing protein [Tindallia californiensis]SDY51146.1 PAS domain S-box-containing protein [Tindallia californiensis]